MSKRKPTATIFFAIVVLLLVAFTIYDYQQGEKNEEAKNQQSKVVQLRRDDLNKVEITGGTETRSLTKKNDVWQITQPIQESADQASVLSLLDSFYAEKIEQTVKEAQGTTDLDLKTYGLDKPLFELKLQAQTATQTLKVGSVHAFDGSLYGQINDQKKVVLLTPAWMTMLTKPVKEFRDKRLYRGTPDQQFATAVVDGHDRQGPVHYELLHDREADSWRLKSPGLSDAVDKVNVEAWLAQIKNLHGSEYASQVGPTKPFVADETITLTTEKNTAYVLKLAVDTKNASLIEATSSDVPGSFTARLALAKGGADGVMLRPDAFYNRHAPFDFDPKDITKVIFHDGKTGKTSEEAIDPAHPDVMIEKLRVLDAVRYLDRNPSQKFSSSLKLLKADQSVVFEMSWGEVIVEKATADRPEARFLPVRTNLSKQVIGLAEKSVADLIERATAAGSQQQKEN